MFSTQLKKYVETKLEERKKYLDPIWEKIKGELSKCTEDERVLTQFLYATMPLRDAGEYDFEVFYCYVTHSLWLREHVEWCASLPEDIFLHYVLYYRINSEDICDCRKFFYEQLKDRIEGITIKEAVLEINYWCAENATYEASDSRTSGPMTVYRSGKGRCGEESTFTVTALRSVGIPARQVYTPRWAHCDDNHAWVEVYLEGKWYFLGACEPEEVLNKGWFLNASSRALLIHSRTFSDFVSDEKEECIGKEDLLVFYNNTATYAHTKLFTFQVIDSNGNYVPNAKISIEVLNMAEFYPIATLYTNEKGKAQITLGLGDIFVFVTKEAFFTKQMVSPQKYDRVELILTSRFDKDDWKQGEWESFEIEAPKDAQINQVATTKAQNVRRRERLAFANKKRENRMKSYFQAEKAEAFPEETEIFHMAKGNFDEVYQFLARDTNPDRKALLRTLSIKDYKDLKADILESHLLEASKFKKDNPEEIYHNYVLCPRIYREELTSFRPYIIAYFTEEEKGSFQKDPSKIWAYIGEHISYTKELDYSMLCATPIGCLKMGEGSPLSKKILFVAICRSLGIAARINPVNLWPEYYKDKDFIRVKGQEAAASERIEEKRGYLRLKVEDGSQWGYYQNWTIAKLNEGQFETLNYYGITFEQNQLTLTLEVGTYRLITTSRMPNGNQHASLVTISISEEKTEEIYMVLQENSMEDMLVNFDIPDFEVEEGSGVTCSMKDLVGNQAAMIAFLEEGAEPTEHVLNEMLQSAEDWNELGTKLVFILKDKSALNNGTLKKTRKQLNNCQVLFDNNFDQVELLARRMYVDPEKLPLLLALKEGMVAVYGCSGYNVGSVDLMLKIQKRW